MSQVYVSMAMSLDGFIAGPRDSADNPAGINGMRFMDWLGGGSSDAGGVDAYIKLDLVRVLEAAATLHLRYQVVRG